MIIIICIAVLIIISFLDCYADERSYYENRAEERHEELMELERDKARNKKKPGQKTTRRRFIKDSDGNVIGEEVIEETIYE